MNNNNQTLEVIRRLLASEEKPKGCQPIDLLQVVRLLVQQNSSESKVALSQPTLAMELACSESTILQSQKRLVKFGWLDVQKNKRRWQANEFTVLTDNLPLDELKKTLVSDEARALGGRYVRFLRNRNPKLRLKKTTYAKFAFRIQTLIDECNGDVDRTLAIMNFAFTHPAFVKKAERGPHELRKSWKSLVTAYGEREAQQQEPSQLVAQRTGSTPRPVAHNTGSTSQNAPPKDYERRTELLGFALSHPDFRSKATRGITGLHDCWPSLEAAYEAAQRQQAETTTGTIHPAPLPGPEQRSA